MNKPKWLPYANQAWVIKKHQEGEHLLQKSLTTLKMGVYRVLSMAWCELQGWGLAVLVLAVHRAQLKTQACMALQALCAFQGWCQVLCGFFVVFFFLPFGISVCLPAVRWLFWHVVIVMEGAWIHIPLLCVWDIWEPDCTCHKLPTWICGV